MEFKAGKCPSCGGDLQVPDSMEKVKCMYCGGEVIVKEAISAVRVEGVASAANLFKMANESINAENYEDAYKYYTRYLELDIDNHEAWYGKAVSAGWQSTLANLRVLEMVQGIKKAIELAPTDKKQKIKKDASLQLNALANAIYKLAYDNFTIYVTLETYTEFIDRMQLIIQVYEIASEYDSDNVEILENIITVTNTYMKKYTNDIDNQTVFLTDEGYQQAKEIILRAEDKIKKNKPEYKASIQSHDKGACYIATAVYGDYDAPEVQVLRHFRDNYLQKRIWGRYFIKFYYFTSPAFADWMRNKRLINNQVRKLLDNAIRKLSK